MMLSCIVATQISVGIAEVHVQFDLDAVALWFRISQLCFNVVKSNAILIGSHQRISSKSFNVLVGGTILNQVILFGTWVFLLTVHYHGHYIFIT